MTKDYEIRSDFKFPATAALETSLEYAASMFSQETEVFTNGRYRQINNVRCTKIVIDNLGGKEVDVTLFGLCDVL